MILQAKGLEPIKDGPIAGETMDKEMSDKKGIEIANFSLSGQFNDSGLDESNEQQSTPSPPVSDKLTLTVSKNLDRSSPPLMIAYCHHLYAQNADRWFPKLTIIVRKAGGTGAEGSSNTQTPFMQLDFEDVRLTSYDCCGSHGSNNDMPTENLSFQFKKFKMQYWSQTATGQQSARMRVVEWNFFRESH
jgi:type VI protein secretion system component Hcp